MQEANSYAIQSHLTGITTQGCGYCGRYGHTEVAYYKKQTDEARSRSGNDKSIECFPKTILKKEAKLEAAEKKKPIKFAQET